MYIIIPVALTIFFSQSVYIANESTGLQPVLYISNPSHADITVEVFTTDITAVGKY